MQTLKISYLGELRTHSTHSASGNTVITDAPIDNHGRGEAFSPTDLLCSSLGSCMITLMGIAGNTHNINMEGTHLSITKIMASNPRKVGEIIVDLVLPGKDYTEKERMILETAALTCPVYLSLHPEVKKTVSFSYV